MKNVWVNGCFDIIHSGHIELLEYAKSLGDHLTVGLDSDNRVKSSKGDNRPIISLNERMKIIKSLKSVDRVVNFDNNSELIELIKNLDITIMVVGEEYRYKRVIGSNMKTIVSFYPKTKNQSTSNIINKILKTYGE